MKKIRFIIAICILFLVSSCSKDEDSIYTNSVLVEGEFLDLNGGFVGFDPDGSDVIAQICNLCSV